VLRAGPFSDERIIRLANRRFIPFYFDLSNRGVAGDPDARKFVVAKRKELGGRAVPTPPVLFMSPDGEVLGEVSNYASSNKVLKAMLKVLEENPRFNKPSEAEKNAESAVAKARIRIDLQDYKGAKKLLEKEESDPASPPCSEASRRSRARTPAGIPASGIT